MVISSGAGKQTRNLKLSTISEKFYEDNHTGQLGDSRMGTSFHSITACNKQLIL